MPQSSVIVAPVVAFPGMNPDTSDSGDNYGSATSAETALQLPFGHMVIRGASDGLCLSCTSQTPQFLGIVPYSAAHQIDNELATAAQADSNGNVGLKPGATVEFKHRGKLWVKIDEDVTPTSAVRVRTSCVSGVGPGSFRATLLSAHTIDISKFARWEGSYTAANGYGLLSFDLRMAANLAADA